MAELNSAALPQLERSIVRDNLLTRPGYTPYCGDGHCRLGMPRTYFNGQQFVCACGWSSAFEPEFILEYKAIWPGQGAR